MWNIIKSFFIGILSIEYIMYILYITLPNRPNKNQFIKLLIKYSA